MDEKEAEARPLMGTIFLVIISIHFVLTMVILVQFLNCCITFGRYCIYGYMSVCLVCQIKCVGGIT